MEHIDVYNTHIECYPYKKDDYPVIEKLYEAEDKFTGTIHPCGYLIDDNKLYLPRGTSLSKLQSVTTVKPKIIDESDPYEKMSYPHGSIYDPRDDLQRQSIDFLKEDEHQMALNLKTGFGKALPLTERIPTPDGWVNMGDIKVGDYVLGSNGCRTKVLGVYPQGVLDVYKVVLRDGRTVRCSPDHLWEVRVCVDGIMKFAILSLRSIMQIYKNYTVYIPAFTHYGRIGCKRDIKNINPEKGYYLITDIIPSKREQCQCILVEAKDHLFLTDQFVLTHNTYCVAAATTDLGLKTIIITPNESLKQQWIKTYNTMFDYRPKHLMNIAGSAIIDAIMEDEVDDADVYFVNHQTLHSYLMQTNGYQFHKFFKKLKVGVKVYDESHLEFANIILIDFFSNTDRTYYLTATFDRSDKGESACFKRAFQSVIEFGYQQSQQIARKHVIYHAVMINSRIDPKKRAVVMGYPSFTAQKYGHYAFFDDPSDTCYNAILEILKKTKDIEGKTMIFVPLIDAVDEVVRKLKRDFPEKTCAPYHSKIPKDEKMEADKKDIIVTTVKSSGTGRDIKGLRVVICAEPLVSKVNLEQVIGRIRPYADDKDTYYFDLCDVSIPGCVWWHNSRMKKLEPLVKQIVMLNM